MKSFLKGMSSILIVTILLCACEMTPRVSSWESPRGFTKAQVFNASIQAGGQLSMMTAASDRESGTISFVKKVGKGEMSLNVQVTDVNGIVKVQTTAHYGGGVGIAGENEEKIRDFHELLFRNLNISDPSAKNIIIEQLK